MGKSGKEILEELIGLCDSHILALIRYLNENPRYPRKGLVFERAGAFETVKNWAEEKKKKLEG